MPKHGASHSLQSVHLHSYLPVCLSSSACRYPIHMAATEGELIVVDFLMFNHADLGVKDCTG